MTTKITRNIIESFLSCKYEGHLKLAGQLGIQSDYQSLLATSRDAVRRCVFDEISASHGGEEDVQRDIALTPTALKRGTAFLLDAMLEDDCLALAFDGLKRVEEPSTLGDFHYAPVLFFEGWQIRKQQRAMLEIYGLLLFRVQGRMPAFGIVWRGMECRPTRIRISTDLREAGRLLEELRQMRAGGTPPRLALNEHCVTCEFRQRCHQQAVEEDNLSLLRGMKKKEIKTYARKGILTVTQLAHTFRPRRKGKRASPRVNRRAHALQALAVRDKKVYVFGTPQLPTSPVHIYLDVEGNPDEGFHYLIGVIVVVGDKEDRYSFWAESAESEGDIFEQFLATVDGHDDFLIFSYGTYERAFLKKMRKRAARKKRVDRVLKSLVNVLSLVYAHFTSRSTRTDSRR
jgi:predicted RecB family nuclease